MPDAGLLEPPGQGTTVPWRWFLDEVTGSLAAAGVAAPGREATWMLEAVSGLVGDELRRHLQEPATRLAVPRLRTMLARRLAGEPLQYVLGSWAFRRLDLFVDRRVLIPRPETEGVVDHVLRALDDLRATAADRRLVVVDLGTGSGAIALAVADERSGVEVHATDASADALEVARANLAGIGQRAARVILHHGHWFEALPADLQGGVDVVVSNPPYIAAGEALPPEVADWEPAGALVAGPRGTEALEAIIGGAGAWLRPGGTVVLELAPHQAGAMAVAAEQAGFGAVRIERDAAGRDRVLVARRRA